MPFGVEVSKNLFHRDVTADQIPCGCCLATNRLHNLLVRPYPTSPHVSEILI